MASRWTASESAAPPQTRPPVPPPSTTPEEMEENRRRLLDPEAAPPFRGPVPPFEDGDAREYQRAHNNSTRGHGNGITANGSFARIDHHPDNYAWQWRTNVYPWGEVQCYPTDGRTPPEPQAPPPPPVPEGATLVTRGFYWEWDNYNSRWAEQYVAAARQRADAGYDDGPLGPVFELHHPIRARVSRDPATGEVVVQRYVGAWLPRGEPARHAVPPPPVEHRDRDVPVDARLRRRLALRIAAAATPPDRIATASAAARLADLDAELRGARRALADFRRAARMASPARRRALQPGFRDRLFQLNGTVGGVHDLLAPSNRRRGLPEGAYADAKDVEEQLAALADEFGGLFYNPKRREIAVLTGEISLPDRAYDVEVPFGRFRIGYPLEEFQGNNRPVVDRFRATPVERRLPYLQVDSNVTHPHVRGESICLGSAAEPLGRMLGSGRLFDAFLIVGTVLTAYGSHAEPYAPPHYWLRMPEEDKRAQLQSRRGSLAPSPRDPDHDYGDEDEDDVAYCSECDQPVSDCECAECCACESLATSSNPTCSECEERCHEGCGQTCSGQDCFRFVCDECRSASCSRCERGGLCSECQVSCSECDANICNRCVRACSICNDPLCEDHAVLCDVCDERFCEGCLEDHKDACDNCTASRCGGFDPCPACSQSVCEACRTTCSRCQQSVCCASPDEDGVVICPDCAAED